MLVLLLLNLFYLIHCNNKSRYREDTELKIKLDLGLDLELDSTKRKIESCGKIKGIRNKKHLRPFLLFIKSKTMNSLHIGLRDTKEGDGVQQRNNPLVLLPQTLSHQLLASFVSYFILHSLSPWTSKENEKVQK